MINSFLPATLRGWIKKPCLITYSILRLKTFNKISDGLSIKACSRMILACSKVRPGSIKSATKIKLAKVDNPGAPVMCLSMASNIKGSLIPKVFLAIAAATET